MKIWTYQIQEDETGVPTERVDYGCDEDKVNPYSSGFDGDPQDGLRVNKVKIILT